MNSVNGSGAASLLGLGGTAAKASVQPANTQKGVDKDTFMKLLVAQLKNQDPLAPQDGAQYVAQLAQFSSLEQLTGVGKKMDQLVELSNKLLELNQSGQK